MSSSQRLYAAIFKVEKSMDDDSLRRKSSKSVDQSLGVLNMDNLKVFGEISGIASHEKKNIGDRLSMERAKALEILQKVKNKPKCVSLSGAHCSKANKENMNENSRARLDKTDYVPFRTDANSINISDLITDETINLEGTANMTEKSLQMREPRRHESGILFEPDEITGRSTLYNGMNKHRAVSPLRLSKTSRDVHDVLATSFMPEIRALAKNKETNAKSSRTLLCSSYTTSFNNSSQSLPRTADMSQASEKSMLSECGGAMFSFSAAGVLSNDSAFSSEEFAAGELMESKLLKDQISWAQGYAAIPTAALSKPTAEKVSSTTNMSVVQSSLSLVEGDPNFSVGDYFNKRSDNNIWGAADTKSPSKFRTPHALMRSANTTVDDAASVMTSTDVDTTPKIDNRTYSLAIPREAIHQKHIIEDSTDSGNNTRNSYLLSLSAIDRALNKMKISTDDSDTAVIHKLLKAKSPQRKSNAQPTVSTKPSKQPYKPPPPQRELSHIESIVELITENKENLDPEAIRTAAQFSDTLSFSESLLNSTEMKAMTRPSNGQPRSPLSPIEIKVIPATNNDSNIDADIDEWPSTPVKAPNRRVQRSKSPVLVCPRKKSPVLLCPASKPSIEAPRAKSPVEDCSGGDRKPSSNGVARSRSPTPSPEHQKKPLLVCPRIKSPVHNAVKPLSNGVVRSPTPSPDHQKKPLLVCPRIKSPVHDAEKPLSNGFARSPTPSPEQKRKPNDNKISPNLEARNKSNHIFEQQHRTPINERSSSHLAVNYSPFSPSDSADRTLTSANGLQKSAAKALTSTRLDNVGKSSNLSPNHAKSNRIGYVSPSRLNASPISSSPSDSFKSPQLNSTNNSERRRAQNGDSATACSSPVNSDSGSSRYGEGAGSVRNYNGYGVAPSRTSSTNSSGVGTVVRSNSRCSNSSEFSHHDGKLLPLKVTDTELCWGSTKLRANSRKSFQVKNTSDKRLVVRLATSGPGFSLVNSQGSILAFQSQECRTITINFSPTVTGAAVGKLYFYPPQGTTNNNSASNMELPLYGYGGNASFQLLNTSKGPVGTAFLTMGEHLAELSHPLVRTIKIHNRGPLLGFALVAIDSSGLHGPRLCEAFEVKPKQMLIQPGDTVTVSITFRPRRDDIKKIAKKIQAVYTLANMRVAVGDEANRQRVRRLVQRMSSEERAKLTFNSLEALWSRFPGECDFRELNDFAKEPTNVASDLMVGVAVHEVALTLNHHETFDNTMESTVSSAFCCFPDGDETVLFRTVYAVSPTPTASSSQRGATHKLYPVDELHEGTVSSTTTTTTTANNSDEIDESGWSVSPTELAYDFYGDRRIGRASLLVRNTFRSRQYFEVTCTHPHLLRFTPAEGYVQPDGGQVEVEVHALQSRPPSQLSPNDDIFIEVSMENERIRVPLKLPKDNFTTTYSR